MSQTDCLCCYWRGFDTYQYNLKCYIGRCQLQFCTGYTKMTVPKETKLLVGRLDKIIDTLEKQSSIEYIKTELE